MRTKLLLLTALFLLLFSSLAFGQSITLDHVDGLLDPGKITTGEEVTFFLRINTSDLHTGITNGFTVYSDDGATWGATVPDTMPLSWTNPWFDLFQFFKVNTDGVGADTVGFGGLALFAGTGIPAGVNEVAYKITVGPMDPSMHGKTLVLDSSFYPPTGSWKWAPSTIPSWDGPHIFTITDPEASTNTPPVLDAIGNKTVDENDLLLFTVTANDAESIPVLTATGLPSGAGFVDNNDGTGTFNWTPNYNQASPPTYSVTFTASDGEFTDEETIEITVNDVNRAPVLTAIGNKSVNENEELSFFIAATDPDGDQMTITSTTLPGTAVLNPMGNGGAQFIWTPTYDDANDYPITFTVSDGDLTDEEAIIITVKNINRQPNVVSLNSNSPVNEGEIAIITIEVSDPDNDPMTVTIDPVPAGGTSSQDGNIFTFEWPTTFNDAGSHYFDLYVNDGMVSINTNTTIEVINVNRPPVLAAIGAKGVTAGGLLEFTVTASDPDGTIPGLSANNVPAAASFTDNGDGTGSFSWQTEITDDISVDVNFIATDGDLTDAELVTITVGEAPKFLTSTTDSLLFSSIEGVFYLDSLYALIEEQNDFNIAFTSTETEDWLTLATVGAGTTPDSLKFIVTNDGLGMGTYSAEVTVSSADAVNDLTIMVYLVVNEKQNTPPVLGQLSELYEITECDILEILITASDVDPEMIELGFEILYDNMVFTDYQSSTNHDTGLFVFTPDFSQAGEYNMTVFAADAKDTVKSSFTITVADCEPGTEGYSVTVATVPAVPGAQIVVPVDFSNTCTLWGFNVSIGWTTDSLVLDSVSFVDSRVTLWESVMIDNDNNYVEIMGTWSEVERQNPGEGNMANLHFSVACETPAGFYPLDVYNEPVFEKDCDGNNENVRPFFISGGVTVDVSGNYVCGYVVDTDGNPIPGATVELWDNYPGGAPQMMTMSSGTGVFSFDDFNTIPFDLYAYMDGYLPGSVENINFAQSGIRIVLTKTEDFGKPNTWVEFRCLDNSSTYLGYPFPVGTVVEAYVRDNVKCGEFMVNQAGVFGPMFVYGEDLTELPSDGARPDDVIRFYVNGIEAIPSHTPIWTENLDVQDLCLEVPNEIAHSCMLYAGWNLVSWNVDTETDDILDVLSSIDECLEMVMGYEQGAMVFEKSMPLFSDLWSVDHMSGYWVKVNCDIELAVVGTPVPATTPIALTTGWNLVSYLPDYGMPTGDALSSVMDNLIIAMGYDDIYTAYIPGDDLYNDLLTLDPCFGYWVKVRNDDALIYPDNQPLGASIKKDNSGLAAKGASSFNAPTNRWVNLYSYNLTLNGKSLEVGTEIKAYSEDGLMVGSYTLKENNRFGFMPVYGDDVTSDMVDGIKAGQNFYLTVNGVETEERFNWSATGDKIEIKGLSAKGTDGLPSTFGLNQNYPNPFNPTTNISFTLPVAGKANVDVYNMLGEKVATIFSGQAQAGINTVEWDGKNENGISVASGIYFYRLTADKYTETRKMTLIK